MNLKNILCISIWLLTTPLFAQELLCPGADDTAQKLASEKITKLESAFTKQERPLFFTGLWSKVEEKEKPSISAALRTKPESKMMEALRKIMDTMSARLSQDRRNLIVWLTNHKLDDEIQVLPKPSNGSFLFVKASRSGMKNLICASVQGELPAILMELGF